MDYTIAYNRFCISKRKQNLQNGLLKSKNDIVKKHNKNGLQLHHIKPLRLNGANKLFNYVLLSREDHIFAHLLLNLSLYQQGNFKALKTLGYSAYCLPNEFLKKHSLKGIKIALKFPEKKDFKLFSLKQAALYYAIVRQKDITDKQILNASIWAVLKRSLLNGSKGGINFKVVFI